MPAAEPPRAFSPGEELVYQIEALGMDAGKGRVTVGTPADRDGVRALPIVAQGRTDSIFDRVYSVRDKYITWWDPATGRVIGSDLQADEGGKSTARACSTTRRARPPPREGERPHRAPTTPPGPDIAGAVMGYAAQAQARRRSASRAGRLHAAMPRQGRERITVPAPPRVPGRWA
jgi:hypothetical protein